MARGEMLTRGSKQYEVGKVLKGPTWPQWACTACEAGFNYASRLSCRKCGALAAKSTQDKAIKAHEKAVSNAAAGAHAMPKAGVADRKSDKQRVALLEKENRDLRKLAASTSSRGSSGSGETASECPDEDKEVAECEVALACAKRLGLAEGIVA